MSTTIIRPNSREEWLEIRRGGIGASEVPALLGLSPFESPYGLWLRKTGRTEPKPENTAMALGHALEGAVAQYWSEQTGREIIKRSAIDWIVRSNERPFMQVSPDRTYWLGDSRKPTDKAVLEIKTTQLTVDPDSLPRHWFTQLQTLLGVSEIPQGSLAWLSRGRDFGYKDIELVPDFFGWICEETERFWKDNVLGGKEPELTTVDDVLQKYATHTEGKIVEVSEDVFAAWQDLGVVREQLAALDERKAELEKKLKLNFGDAEAISYQGQTLATWKTGKASRKFDAKTFTKDYPELAGQYTHETAAVRRFLVK